MYAVPSISGLMTGNKRQQRNNKTTNQTKTATINRLNQNKQTKK